MEYAVIDVGSNTVRLVIYTVNTKTDEFSKIYDKKAMVGLAGYIDDGGMLTKRGISKAIEAIGDHMAKARQFKVRSIHVFATACIRNASNCEEACKAIDEALGCSIAVLSGEDEARLGFLGAAQTIDAQSGILFDIGGGSTEIVHFQDRAVVSSVSLPYGSLKMFLAHVDKLFPTYSEQLSIESVIAKELENNPAFDGLAYDTVFGIGGAVRAGAKLINERLNDGEPRTVVSAEQVVELQGWAQDPSNATLRSVLAVAPERVHTLFPGMAIAQVIMHHVGAKELAIAKYGVREGYLLERVLKR